MLSSYPPPQSAHVESPFIIIDPIPPPLAPFCTFDSAQTCFHVSLLCHHISPVCASLLPSLDMFSSLCSATCVLFFVVM